MAEESRVHPDCRNASNPYHVCVEFCFLRIAERSKSEPKQVDHPAGGPDEALHDQGISLEEQSGEENVEVDYAGLTERQKRLFNLRLKMNEARKANQTALVAEKKKIEDQETRGISKQKWMEDRKKKIGKLLDLNGLDMTSAYMLDTQEKTLCNAYKKRTKNIDSSSLEYGKAPKISEDKIDKMVKELYDRDSKGKAFSRRRKFHEEKYIDSINDRNEHFNKKIERAFGKCTLDIKNNLERGLPD
ncbi:hypothetical protein MKW92_035363 [Papaver armeniacum]|nr:hypothetical protein MKW92_035363 [Papaver armeniacum]